MKVVYRWYCHTCGGQFYLDFDDEAEFCPFCKSTELEEKNAFVIKSKEKAYSDGTDYKKS